MMLVLPRLGQGNDRPLCLSVISKREVKSNKISDTK